MKRCMFLIALLVIAATVLVLAGCDVDVPAPVETQTEKVTATDIPETEVETTPAEMSPAALLNQILSERGEDMSMDMDLTVSWGIDYGTTQNTTTFPIKLTMVADGEQMRVTGTLMGQDMSMIYAENVLYVDFPILDKKFKCAMTLEEFQSFLDRLGGNTSVEGEESEWGPADLFTSVTAEQNADTRDVHITAKGIQAPMIPRVAPYLVPMLSSIGFVGSQWGEDGYEVNEEKALLQSIALLESVSEDTMTVVFVADEAGVLHALTMDLTMVMDESESAGIKRTAINFTGDVTVTPGEQTVTPPADANDYSVVAMEKLMDAFFLSIK